MYSNNFGVIEVANPKTKSAPGWAYVPDVGTNAVTATGLQPSNRKRARNQGPNLSGADLTARQEAKIRKDLEALDRDSNRDANIPIPPRAGSARSLTKSTPNVRKILQSQKTFANHLDDYDALMTLNENNPPPHPNQHTKPKTPHPNQYTKKPPQPNQYTRKAPQPNQYTKRKAAAEAASSSRKKETSRSRSRRGRAESEPDPESEQEPESEATRRDTAASEMQGVEMTGDASAGTTAAAAAAAGPRPVLTPYDGPPPPTHPGDNDPLLVSVVPDLPTDAELRKLLAHPPLSYAQARARWRDEDRQYPARRFCDVCGYWGRVRCMKCGTPVCALDCLELHREECITRYGL
ncbi:hypothetical protein SODALDRAFT_331887 [Sodiomyces alkalinus F11]|uniref:HIT-type domain-containing protein n=1 Tax=Sodiomyces alkalinus (strain CBS 110278 / VKM F-3762 / F11) TaxID=1314773 RepID=A0A3N2PZ21_SODAK|nr:hypothetical protein SODALDRAFT_331887 [Sodiomyces alkalinus F11]ROT39771.1 hypothetical protein SODALDRAFT_331887 [Sodiomyces alkalinus F11]